MIKIPPLNLYSAPEVYYLLTRFPMLAEIGGNISAAIKVYYREDRSEKQ